MELICDRIGILNKGELVAIGTLNELLGTEQSYQVSGHGGTETDLKPWLQHLIFQGDTWHGQLEKELPEFLTYIAGIGAMAITIDLARQTLEEFFIEQIKTSRHKD